MTEIRRVVIALDGSHRAELAVPYGGYIGAMLGAEIELLTVTEKPTESEVELDDRVQISLGESQGLLSTWVKDIDLKILTGDPAEQIVKYASDSSTLVAMATHGRTGLMRRLSGSVAEGVLRHTKSPVIAIKAPNESSNVRFAARVNHLMLPLDQTEVGEGAIPLCRDLASRLNAEVTLLHAGNSDARSYLERIANQMPELEGKVKFELTEGEPGPAIARLNETIPNLMVMMCSKNANRPDGSVRGSVTDYVIRHASQPVLVVPYSQS